MAPTEWAHWGDTAVMLGEPQRDRCCPAPGGDSGVLDGRSVSGERLVLKARQVT